MKQGFGIGVIGATGYIGTPYRAEIRDAPEEATLVSLCARRRDLLEKAGQEDGAEHLTDDWREVVGHPEVDFVIVATPDALHREPVLACAKAGKHVLCEKPVGIDSDEAGAMWDAYRDTRLGHFVPYWTRYVPAFIRAREVFASGALGDLRGVVYRWHNPRPLAMPFTWRDDSTLSAAGSIADVGSHAYDTLRWILDKEAVRVVAHADVITEAKPDLGAINLDEALEWGQSHRSEDSTKTRKGSAYDYANIAFELEGGAVGTMTVSHAPYLRKGLAPELELHGSDASLAVDRITGNLTLAKADGSLELLGTYPHEGWGNRFRQHVFPALRAQIDNGESIGPDLQDGYRVQLFTDAVVQSAKSGLFVTLAALAGSRE